MKLFKTLFSFVLAASALVSCGSDNDEPIAPEVEIAGRYTYTAITDVTTSSSSTPFTDTESTYLIEFDEAKEVATVTINNARFAAQMPALTMVFNGVSVELTKLGYKLRAQSLIPEIGGVPYPKYEINALVGEFTYTIGGQMNFDCMNFKVKATLSVPKTEAE